MYKLGTLPKNCPYIKNDKMYQERKDLIYETFHEFKNKNRSLLSSKGWSSLKEDYDKSNIKEEPDRDYSTLFSELCPNCDSYKIDFEYKSRYSILFGIYKCLNCGHEWNTFKKQLNYTLHLLKGKKG